MGFNGRFNGGFDGRDERGRYEPELPTYHDDTPWVPPDGYEYEYGYESEHEPEPAKKRSRLPLLIRLFFLVPLVFASAAAVAVGGLFIVYTMIYPDPLSMRPKGTGPTIRIVDADGSVIAERGVSRAYIPLDMLAPMAANAVVAIEDQRFFSHFGVDPIGMARAALVNLRAGRLVEGGSTITQQLVKNLFLTSDRTLARKAEELVLALWIELRLSKRDILELYLNRVYFGGGAHGIEAAAQRYFGKSARDLTLGQSAVIAGLLKAPSRYAPSASPTQAIARGHVVIGRMAAAGFITHADAEQAVSSEIHFSPLMRAPNQADMAYAVDYVLDVAAEFDGADTKEIVIETTLDGELQRKTSQVVEAALTSRGAALSAGQGAVVVLAPDGGIRALVGGRSYADSQFNRAVRAHRQPGSAFKPVVYLTALERGLAPDSMMEDAPITAGRWTPRNENGRFIGPVTLRDALAQSINSVAVRLLLDAGATKVAATARRLGMKSELRRDASLALGTSEVSLLDLTGAYAAFANGGYVNEPYVIRRVRTAEGRVLFQRFDARSDPAIPLASVAAMNDMLRAVVERGTGRRAALPGHIVAGKTGTSQDYRDAWFVGYTAHLTAGVWVGNDDGKRMERVGGGTLPAEIWHEVMRAAHADRGPLPLPHDAARPAPPATAGTPRHPAGQIDDDFIAQMLDAPSDTRAISVSPSGTTTVMPDGRIVVAPPVFSPPAGR
ncbi:penicillin-binding protein 1A [Hyphomicrobium nitrativorans NL23]|uniref:Penicillin-binding protein 1A n=1 Tax=Hyphomicrobium nitrativorans NL23 TaxID=1029756 RepID=V5SIA2_9HYPH|nr:PBP1A family penicillin-binding protein [Hyphomicrobium nitrativorans]AHB49775.1 penicillin-binding protein 1A [Hyphomicrobium nitrativorans NL23]